jgi:methyl-accepting chemotaxis protein
MFIEFSMKNLKLGVKLITDFILTAMIALKNGIVGLQEIGGLKEHVDEIGIVRLPSVESMLNVKGEVTAVRDY